MNTTEQVKIEDVNKTFDSNADDVVESLINELGLGPVDDFEETDDGKWLYFFSTGECITINYDASDELVFIVTRSQ